MQSYWFLIERGLDKLEDAKAIRHTVFVEEQGFEDEFDDIDPIAHHLVVYSDDTAVATGRVFPGEGKQFIIGRIAVLQPYRKEGFGRIVMENLENQARALGGESVYLAAQMQARGFYESLGYKPCGELFLEQSCPHLPMEKSLMTEQPGENSI